LNDNLDRIIQQSILFYQVFDSEEL